jgi:hypothetical protein
LTDIRLVLTDIDGCLSGGEMQPFNLPLLEFIADINRRARVGAAPFSVMICSGRPATYVEAVAQLIDATMPAIYENGNGLYFPTTYRFAFNPLITPAMRAELAEIRRVVQRELVERDVAIIQPGKEASMTIFPVPTDLSLTQLAELTRQTLSHVTHDYVVKASVSCVEILSMTIDKGVGVDWLVRELGMPATQMAGIGDAPADLTFLRRMGHSATVANATNEVKAAVGYVSPQKEIEGVVDILKRWLQ